MKLERDFARFACTLQAGQVPNEAKRIIRWMVMAVTGTGIAGAGEDGIEALRDWLTDNGGAPQATTFVFGDRLPAHAAAQFNGTMCRALDYCDAMAPGPHIGSALFPAALAAAELAGGCSGSEFLAALTAGAEISSRLNLSERQYDGFDPTGIAVVFSATAAASRILGLTETETLHALALAFNRCGGSFQSHVDGSLGVRVVQGWVAEAGVQCAQLAKRGVTGPVNFLEGHYGYGHLYGRGTLDLEAVGANLGEDWWLHRMVFKKYPSCGVTQGVTELALSLVKDGVEANQVRSVQVRLPPYAFKLVGKTFDPGSNPRVDAQFSAAYCVANALVRRSSRLAHFSPVQVLDPSLRSVIDRITVLADPSLDAHGHTAVDLTIDTLDGRVYSASLNVAPGFPGADLDEAQHRARFADCLAYAPRPIEDSQVRQYLDALDALESIQDVRTLLPLLQATKLPA
jgi:2-methylcitrate dehydratase PrpD